MGKNWNSRTEEFEEINLKKFKIWLIEQKNSG